MVNDRKCKKNKDIISNIIDELLLEDEIPSKESYRLGQYEHR